MANMLPSWEQAGFDQSRMSTKVRAPRQGSAPLVSVTQSNVSFGISLICPFEKIKRTTNILTIIPQYDGLVVRKQTLLH